MAVGMCAAGPSLRLSKPSRLMTKKFLFDEGATMSWSGVAFVVWIVAAWLTHIVVCLKTAAWGFLIAGALLFPIAWVHGTGVWFGWW